MARPSRDPGDKEANRMSLWTQESQRVVYWEVVQHEDEPEDDLIDNKILDCNLPREESSDGPVEDYITRFEGERLAEENIKTAIEPIQYVL